MFDKRSDDQLHVIRGPACRHLRSKGMFITGQMNPEEDCDGIGDGHCWCNQTQHVMGPDNGAVERELCSRYRDCYEPIV